MNSKQGEENRRRHCMLVHAHYPFGETRVERQAQALIGHGYEVDVICLRLPTEPALAIVNGAQVHRLPVRRHEYQCCGAILQLFEYLAFFVLAFIHLTRLHLRNRYNVVQVHNLPDFLVFVALVPKLTGARVILDLHDLMPEFYAERFGRPMRSMKVRLICWQEWLSCRFADHVITVTELWRRTLVERGQPANKVTVAMNVADDRVFHRNAVTDMPGECDSIQRQWEDGRFRLIYHGAMDRRHGLDLALRALNLVRQTAPDVHLTLHGGAESSRQALASLADELGLKEHVQFSPDFVPTDELPKLLNKAHLAVVPYRNGVFTGGILPTKMMEYAALGIPVIAARTPAIAAHFDDTIVQFFTPGDVDELAHCILTLYRDRTRLDNLARNIIKFNEQHNWPAQRAVYLRLVDRLAEKQG